VDQELALAQKRKEKDEREAAQAAARAHQPTTPKARGRPRKKAQPSPISSEEEIINFSSDETILLMHSVNRRGRKINLPERFRT
jgi:hypothetical protein